MLAYNRVLWAKDFMIKLLMYFAILTDPALFFSTGTSAQNKASERLQLMER